MFFFVLKFPPISRHLKESMIGNREPSPTVGSVGSRWFGFPDLQVNPVEGQAVLVLGQGNAALETAQELQQYTSELHLLARGRPLPQGGTGVRLAYQTHYVTWCGERRLHLFGNHHCVCSIVWWFWWLGLKFCCGVEVVLVLVLLFLQLLRECSVESCSAINGAAASSIGSNWMWSRSWVYVLFHRNEP